MDTVFKRIVLPGRPKAVAAVEHFLQQAGLRLEQGCEELVVAEQQGRLVGCGAIAGYVLKCIAVDPQCRGEGLSLRLLTELLNLAWEKRRNELFLFTRPQNAALFEGGGFWPIARAGDSALLMENSRDRLARYCRQLRMHRQPGARIGAIVMNANPFTLGHRWLVEQAVRQCDWLHLFVVKEDASFFRYQDRCSLIEKGIAGIPHVTLHPGSQYVISRATFPGYFLKDKGVVDDCHSQIDLQLFRQHLAPALGITHRFVGSEPLCPLTRAYNQRMKTLLSSPDEAGPPVRVVELPRIEQGGAPVSASRVRKLYEARDWAAISPLVPPATFTFLTRLAAKTNETA